MRCQLPGEKWGGRDPQHPASETQRLRRKRGILLQTRYVELFIVVDKERYQLMGQNKTAVTEEMVHLVNYLDSMYIALNIRIVLVGLEIWTQENKIRLEGGAGDVLANFVQWREQELVPRQRHDSAQFVLKKAFGGTAGMAYVGTVCSKSHAGGINVFGPISVQMFSSIVAHELGHNLGMNHDDERKCDCGSENCIMNSGASGARNFSSCSEEDFEKLTLSKGGSCLLNIPRPEETYSIPYCGNKLVDAGEECDCGTSEICKHYQCVDVSVLGYSCNAEHQCNGRGVCNSNKNCHCHPGWAPPYCDAKGYGGSLDSGPPYNDVDNTTRNWLLAFFCLILPLLLLLLFTYLARNQLVSSLMPLIEACCGRFRRRSDNRTQESVHASYPPNIPYSTRDMSAPMSTQANRYPVPAYTANLQPYCDTYHYTSPLPSPTAMGPSMEQHCIPMRPPPPVLKTAKTQEPIYPSRPAPLPPV
uniref:disintegrin and metalloproteinase domain-containing protein 9 n=1 Tax=Podarcis muralis TaxID=64176 RepID=UPI0010A0551F|nr:disintegrin and metalloproteinase domain-containing protein 9 [Podarcis muralis]XP_028563129.1 disintegrin and metalloproteinase domain-containing protein 9 [Podarcis muralis]